MKQILQDIKTGETRLADVPVPAQADGSLLIKTRASLVSAGTERMLIDFGRANYLEKARQQPDKVKMVLDKIRTDGVVPTLEAIRSKLNHPLPLGYCNAGVVDQASVDGFKPGDRVASNGHHAEYVRVPANLCARIPDNVSDEEAAFTVLGAIALQGIRLAGPTIGETFVVTGLGLIGQLTVQLLVANGCSVIGVDLDPEKCALAERFGARAVDLSTGADPVSVAMQVSGGSGIDGVLITASTKSNEPVSQAARMCRKRGRIVLVGVTGLELSRADFYEKELSFQVSCSYGPGRYDPGYEDKGRDYPLGFVRWTEQRNFEAILDLLARKKLDVGPLITHRFELDRAVSAYGMIAENSEPYLGILLTYGREDGEGIEAGTRAVSVDTGSIRSTGIGKPAAAVIGAGNYTGQVFLPALAKTGARLKHIVSGQGVSGTHWGKTFGFEESTTDADRVFRDPETGLVFITTRHDSHFRLVTAALAAGKHTFVEKPLCLTLAELEEIRQTYESLDSRPVLMVGFNRRFAPHVARMKELLSPATAPKSFIMTVNAGHIPPEHWTQDEAVGGGRIIGEACHFIDLLYFLAGNPISDYGISRMASAKGDTATIRLGFADGSLGTIHYFANGSRAFPKERLEVFCDGHILQLDNFKTLKGFGWPGFKKMGLWRQDKGHAAGIRAFIEGAGTGRLPIPMDQIIDVSRIAIELANG